MSLSTIIRHAIKVYPNMPYTDPKAVRHLRRAYVRARLYLGDRWILAQHTARKIHAKRDRVVLAVTATLVVPMIVGDVVARVM